MLKEPIQKIFIIKKKKQIKKEIWSKEEDDFLIEISKKIKKGKWIIASERFNLSKSPFDCYLRYKKISKVITKGKWTKAEDEKLISLYKTFGPNWKLISKIIGNRCNKQVRNRFIDYLDEKNSSKKFSSEEDQKLLKLYKEHRLNRKPFMIAFPNRSYRKLRNRTIYLLRKNYKNKEFLLNANKNINHDAIVRRQIEIEV